MTQRWSTSSGIQEYPDPGETPVSPEPVPGMQQPDLPVEAEPEQNQAEEAQP